jgi:hypothetical protein
MKNTIIIAAGLPSMKNEYCKMIKEDKSDITAISLRSDYFRYCETGKGFLHINTQFPENYVNIVKELIGVADIVFVSTFPEVLTNMDDTGVDYVLVYPDRSMKGDWNSRCGDNPMGQLVDVAWDEFIDKFESSKCPVKFILSNELGEKTSTINDFTINKIRKLYAGWKHDK